MEQMNQLVDSDQNFWVMTLLIIFFAISLLIGIIPSRKASKGFLSFMIADKSLPWWAIGGTLYATFAGTATLLGWVGSSARIGMTSMWQTLCHGASFMMLALFLVPILIRMKRVTLAEPIGERFDNSVRKITSGLSFFRMVGSVASQIIGIGVILSMFTELDLTGGIIASAIILVIYVSLGGMYGVAYADTFQGLIMFAFVVFAPFYILNHIGGGSLFAGINMLVEKLPHSHRSISNGSTNQIMGWIVVMTASNLLRPELFGRIFAARSAKEGILTWVTVTNMIILTMCCVTLLGLIAKVTVPEFSGTQDQYGPALFRAIDKPWLTVFYVLGVVAAAVSTASSSMLGSSSHYVTDFHLPIFYKDNPPTAHKLVWLSRLAVIFFTALACWWALAWKDIIAVFQFGYTVLVGGVLIPYLGMFFWPRMTTSAAKWSAIIGGGTAIFWKFFLQPYNLLPWSGVVDLDPSIPSLLLSIGVAIAVSYCGKPEYEKVYKFAKAYDLKKMVSWAENGMARENPENR